MAGERRMRILSQLAAGQADGMGTKKLCEVCLEVTEVTGAGIMLMSGETAQGSVCTTNAVSALIEDLQYSLGEGPCVDAYHAGRPVLEPDLARPDVWRWPAFRGPALDAGVRSVFGFPLQVGTVRLGALNLYCDRPGPLSDDQHTDAVVMAGVAAGWVLLMQAGAPPGQLAAELESGADLRSVVHQAAGMVSVQLGISVGEALVRLRAYAFANNRPLTDVADHVVSRRLRFDHPDSEGDPSR
jgi:ANTAR domain/GAF domain